MKAACTVWTGAKGSKESDLSVFLFRYEYSANFFYKLWKRIRKYNGLVTGLTQNVDELLRSDTARLMLANSEFLVMLNQSATDRAELAKLLNISDNQLGYVTNVPAGCGLIRCAGNIVPFTNSFPKDTKLYKLMSTNPSEKRSKAMQYKNKGPPKRSTGMLQTGSCQTAFVVSLCGIRRYD